MKNKQVVNCTKVILRGTLALSIILLCTSFSRRADRAYLALGQYLVYYDLTLQQLSSGFVLVVDDALYTMQPGIYTANGPSFYGGGLSNTYIANAPDGRCAISAGGRDNPNVGGETLVYSNNGGTYTEFDIIMNTTGNFAWGNGVGNWADRATALRHELGHGVGLGHSRDASQLMYKNIAVNSVKTIGNDEKNGYVCIYESYGCEQDECGPAAVELSLDTELDDQHKLLKWTVETDAEYVKGFNIYKKTGKHTYAALNAQLIKSSGTTNEYAFELPAGASFKKNTYYLEVLQVGRKGTYQFKAFK